MGQPVGDKNLPFNQDVLGRVVGNSPSTLINVTPALDTSAYAVGDVFFVSTLVANAVKFTDGFGTLLSLALVDAADVGPALDIYFFDANVTLGTINVAPSISDANALNYMGHVSIAAADWKDLGGVRVAESTNIGLEIKASASSKDLYIASVTQTAGTWAASDLLLRVGIWQD